MTRIISRSHAGVHSGPGLGAFSGPGEEVMWKKGVWIARDMDLWGDDYSTYIDEVGSRSLVMHYEVSPDRDGGVVPTYESAAFGVKVI